jgi:hypothetical protein
MAAGILNPAGTPMPLDATVNFFFMNGDADHDRDVDINDLGILATNWQAAGSEVTFSKGDFNYDHVVDIGDLGVLATNWQSSLPQPSTPAFSSEARRRARGRIIDELV